MPRPKGSKNKKDHFEEPSVIEESPVSPPPAVEPHRAGIVATVTTANMIGATPKQELPDNHFQAGLHNVDLTKCLKCGKELIGYVASAHGKFCNDACLKKYYE